jgi:DNA invertase Pin-like site-specific DNA recombinase
LGLEAQRAAVQQYAASINSPIKGEFVEVESGTRGDRPQLLLAIGAARRGRGRLVIARLDRLSRDPDFLGHLMKTGVDFVACDNPNATRFTVRIYAALAEEERDLISRRTRAALAAAKAKGAKLGSARPGHWAGERAARRAEGQRRAVAASAESRRRAAVDAYSDLLPLIKRLRAEGLSLSAIAARLNAAGHQTRGGKAFHAQQVKNILDRAE